MGWIRIHAKFDSKCHYCRAAILKGERVAGLPPEESGTGKWLVVCMHCYRTKGLAGAVKPEKTAKATTLSDIVGGVKSNNPDNALDRLMNEEFEEEFEPQKKETEKYSLAWFAAGAKWQLG